jgi:hypothetical protein
MRKLLLALAAPALLTANAQLDMGLVAHWNFGAGSLADVSGNAHNGTTVGNITSTTDRNGSTGCAMQFPGETSHIAIPHSTDFDIAADGAFTISLWYQGGSEEWGDQEWLFAKRANSAFSNDYALSLYDLNRALGNIADENYLWSPVMPPIPDVQWHHIAYIQSNGNQQLWQDNVLQAWDSTQQAVVSQSTEGIVIGQYFEGAIDDIRFYGRDLSAAEVGLLFQETGNCVATGIAESATTTITVAPNPTTGTLTVQLPSGSGTQPLELFDTTGRSVLQQNATGTTTLHLDQLPSGLYFLRCGTGAQAEVLRVAKH